MFLKPFTVKSNSLLKNQESKKVKESLLSYVNVDACACDKIESVLGDLVPTKNSQIRIVKLVLNSSENSHAKTVDVYCNPKNVIGLQFEKIFVPSLQTIWTIGQVYLSLPCFIVHKPVVDILKRGADVMAPGILNLAQVGAFESNQVCVLCHTMSCLPFAVGITLVSSTELQTNGISGKAIKVVSIQDDQLVCSNFNTLINPPLEEEFTKQCCVKSASELEISEETNLDDTIERLEALDCAEGDVPEDKPAHSFPKIEDLLQYCLLAGLKKAKNDFPILVSTFQAQYLIPACPQGCMAGIKKSSFKKSLVFFKHYESLGLIHLTLSGKDVWSIEKFNPIHDLFKGFRLLTTEPALPVVDEVPEDSKVDIVKQFVFPEIQTLYFLTKDFSSVFGGTKGEGLLAQDLRAVIKTYVATNELQSKDNPKNVILDPVIAKLVLDKKENVEFLSWQNLFERVTKKLQCGYCAKFADGKEVIGKEAPYPVVKVDLQKRKGNKSVTVISGLEKFRVDLKQFANYVQHKAACSASVSEDSANGRFVVQIQGNQTKFLKTLFPQMKFPTCNVQMPSK